MSARQAATERMLENCILRLLNYANCKVQDEIDRELMIMRYCNEVRCEVVDENVDLREYFEVYICILVDLMTEVFV